ncbi:MAG: thermonuclease family protein [Alphaproteobacteria bacterium]|nr:thermonuclease family protein [Alphaproteobacteria bacterium]
MPLPLKFVHSDIMLRFLIILCCLSFSTASISLAKEEKAAKATLPDFVSLKHTNSGRVDKVINALTISLKDGKIVRLSSLDIPDFSNSQDSPYADLAYKALTEMLPEGTEVILYQTRQAKKGRVNRMNHQLAHIVTKKSDMWIQGELLSAGLARVLIAPNAPEMAGEMLTLENQARQQQLSIWENNSPYQIFKAEPPEGIPQQGFVIVEGTVTKAANVRNNVYLNFGADWKSDFTIMVTPNLRKKLAQKRGIHALSLGRERLRVRGWVRDYNGPLIELDVAEHLEYPLAEIQNEAQDENKDEKEQTE